MDLLHPKRAFWEKKFKTRWRILMDFCKTRRNHHTFSASRVSNVKLTAPFFLIKSKFENISCICAIFVKLNIQLKSRNCKENFIASPKIPSKEVQKYGSLWNGTLARFSGPFIESNLEFSCVKYFACHIKDVFKVSHIDLKEKNRPENTYHAEQHHAFWTGHGLTAKSCFRMAFIYRKARLTCQMVFIDLELPDLTYHILCRCFVVSVALDSHLPKIISRFV